MKVLITGATGLVGSKLLLLCQEQHIEVNYLTTSKHKLNGIEGAKGFYWNPKQHKIDAKCIEGVEKIIHLAGSSVFKRWTNKQKQRILNSRLESTYLLYDLLANNEHKVTQVVSASAIGIYPDSLQNLYQEETKETANTFLGNTVMKWEHAVDQFWNLGLEVAKIRIGLVLAENGGALAMLKKTINSYLGAPLGSGNQWQSWIHVEDLARIFLYALKHNFDGIYNAVAPNPVTNKQLTKAIAKRLGKPLALPHVPAFVLKLLLGEMAQIVLSSQLVSNRKIDSTGFIYYYTHLDSALDDLI